MDIVPIFWEFLDVFPSYLLRVPLDRNIDFVIDLESGTKHFSITRYRMTPIKLKYSKVEL